MIVFYYKLHFNNSMRLARPKTQESDEFALSFIGVSRKLPPEG